MRKNSTVSIYSPALSLSRNEPTGFIALHPVWCSVVPLSNYWVRSKTRSREDTTGIRARILQASLQLRGVVQVCIGINGMEILVRRSRSFLRFVRRQMGILRKSVGDLFSIAFGEKVLLDRYVGDSVRFALSSSEKQRDVLISRTPRYDLVFF